MIWAFTKQGSYDAGYRDDVYDLFLASTKKEGWIHIFATNDVSAIFTTRDEAKKVLDRTSRMVLDTIKINWEE